MAEVPVSDVLCDAVEYLSKLGANLRTRSDSLKEKKITKNKLKNSHAIQKAAAKLLLICEISKKSLENVERGMKNVLNIVNAGQEEIVSGSDSKRNASKYQYFEFDTYKLRISKKVPVKHYMSVKVLAKCMPSSMIEKYPVYCDCKLLQLRKKETNKQETIELKAEALKDKFKTKPQTAIKSKKKLHNSDSENSVNNEPVLQYKANGLTTSPFKRDEVGQPKTVVETSIHNDSDKLEKNKLDGKSSEKLIERNTEKRNERPKIRKRIVRFADESDSDNEKTESVVKENSLIQNTPSNDDDVVCISPDSLAGDTKQNTSDNEITDSANSDVSDSKTKPLIKCVSISKLLKPDIIDKVVDNIASPKKRKAPHSKPPKLLTSKETSKTTSKGNMSKISNNGDETEEFWKLKRKEVSDFKSKEFVIKVVRLPKLTKDFLIKNKLKKVTQAGKIIEEILEDSCDRDIHNKRLLLTPPPQEMEKATEEEKITEEAQQVKTSLLNESDSENSIKIIPSSNNRVKRKKVSRLSIDSEESKIKEVNENKKRALLDDSDSDSSSKISSHRSEELVKKSKENEIKNTSDCSLQSNETDRCKEIKKLAANEIDQSFVNKNALLNDSDSDDMYVLNDRNVLKNDEDLERDFEALLHSKNSNEKDETCQTLNNSDSNQLHESINNNEMPNSEPTSELNHQQDHNSDESTQSFVNKNNKRQRSSDGETPDPKKMNSDGDDAKNILLRYSSSEDEDLTSTLKNIKETLLKGDSSDEELKMQKKKLTSDKESDKSFENNSSGTDKDRESDCEKDRKKKKRKVKRTKIGASKSKARDSSTDKSDIQDDKHINGLTNLKSLLRKRRRRSRRSSNDSSASAVHTKSRGKMAKAPRICNEDILEAESASEDPSDEDVDGHEEELPTVVLSGLNGESGEHLAKDDLLGDSDTSEGKEEKDTEDSKKDTSEDSDNVKSKRRKANAISSDDEAGSSRRKKDRDLDVKLSDFEDSDDDNSETGKKKRKMKVEDSDGSSDSNDGGKKKRRRIKQVDESDMSESDNENEGRNKHGRKNIRKVMGKNQLEEATKKAARQEKERMARIAERQKMYNNLDFDESGKPDEVVLDKVVLDFDPETKEPLIQLDKGLVKKLKPHQANGIKFMWDACFESVKRIKKDKGSGCILAHCMGLGKTLQVISLTHTLLTHSELTGVHRVLVVCPLSTVLNWVNEFQMWLKNTEKNFEVDIYELSRFKQNSERAFQLQQWLDNGGVCVLGYEMFRNLSADNNKKFKKKMLKSFQQSLVDPGPDLVVCDEGHLLKNEKTSLSQSMNKVRTLRRIVLTGTPLQNNLKEYYCMVQFVKPNLLGKYNEYLNRFVNPITNGQYTDSTEHDIKIMKRRSHVLHKMLDGAVQRRDYGVLAPFLPPKHEYVLFITLTDVQVKLYQHYLDNYSRRPLPGKSSGFLFPDFQSLQRIWTHPLVLKYNSERYEIMQQKKRDKEEEEDSEGSLVDFIDDDSTPNESTTDDSSDDLSDASDDSRKKKKNKSSKKNKDKGRANTRRGTRANPVELTEPEPELVEVKNENPTEWWIKLVEEEQLDDLRNSHKLVLLFDILRQCETIGDKLLVFSQSLYSLDLIEHFLGKVDEATQEGRVDEKLGNHVGSWSPGIDYFRLDGSTSCENRSIWCKNFNREDNQRARLFLISTRAGGLGINLVAANRVVIFDVSWNPSHDVQSIFRVYRFGQKKPCYVYRFLAMGTMEEKIYERQVTKQAISKRVIDEQQIDRHYAENDLAELYKFEPEPPSPRPLPPLPKDRLFAEMLREHDKQIYKYHEHDSLLENKEEETLSEEERKAAWEDFENEKNKPPPAPFPNTWNMHNGMMGGLLAQQQQQLAYAAVAAMLRKDLPNVNEQQIRDMLPLIYNANPQLMQKMNEIYKYPQAGMMNPAMMNQVMGAAAGGVGGSSSLQYEPPWQRQHQQQQQMRLQQIMQHQNQMGAKFYAGGLGSRDPVAMALQQQRAREMLGGGGAAGGGGASDARRPRGRPPGPRVPAAPHDVVDLDSD